MTIYDIVIIAIQGVTQFMNIFYKGVIKDYKLEFKIITKADWLLKLDSSWLQDSP